MSALFSRILVAYDGSEPSEHALAYALAIGRTGTAVDAVYIVDEISAIAESTAAGGLMDPTPVLEALESQGRDLLDAATKRGAAAGVTVTTAILRDRPIAGIAAAAAKNGDELIVLGTHARSGLPRAFLGSTTEGVLRSSTVPILAVTGAMTPPEGAPFRKVLIAVDESDPADAAVAFAAHVAQAAGTTCVLCTAVDTRDLYEKAATYGFDPTEIAEQLRAHGGDVLDHARLHAGFPAGAVSVSLVEDDPGRGIIAEAERTKSEAIVIGSHGRRGLQRLFLGSVAEYVVRHSPVPVFVLRQR